MTLCVPDPLLVVVGTRNETEVMALVNFGGDTERPRSGSCCDGFGLGDLLALFLTKRLEKDELRAPRLRSPRNSMADLLTVGTGKGSQTGSLRDMDMLGNRCL